MKSQQLKNLTGIVSENQIWENTSLWPDSVQQWFFCIPSSKFVTLTKFTTGTRNGIFFQKYKPFQMWLKRWFPTNISPLVNVLTVSFINSLLFRNHRHQKKLLLYKWFWPVMDWFWHFYEQIKSNNYTKMYISALSGAFINRISSSRFLDISNVLWEW